MRIQQDFIWDFTVCKSTRLVAGILLVISVDGPKAGCLGAAKAPSGAQGQRPGRGSQGGEAPRAENDSSIAGSLYLSLDMFVAIFSMLFIQNLH